MINDGGGYIRCHFVNNDKHKYLILDTFEENIARSFSSSLDDNLSSGDYDVDELSASTEHVSSYFWDES